MKIGVTRALLSHCMTFSRWQLNHLWTRAIALQGSTENEVLPEIIYTVYCTSWKTLP